MSDLVQKVDFENINKQIKKEELNTNMIRIIYEGLTRLELLEIGFTQKIINPENNKILASYPENLNPLHQNKAVGVLYLSA